MNMILSSTIKYKTPFELSKTKPTYAHLREFGSVAFASLINNRHKSGPKIRRCIFFRYPFCMKGYKLLDLENGKVFISRNVVFYDSFISYRLQVGKDNSLGDMDPQSSELQSPHEVRQIGNMTKNIVSRVRQLCNK